MICSQLVNRKTFTYTILSFLLFILPCIIVTGEEDETNTRFVENDIIHVPTEIIISEDELIYLIRNFRIVYIGETHDNYSAHQVQFKIIKDLFRASGGNIAIGMEMFQKKSQEKLDAFVSGEITEKQFLKEIWFPDWGYDFDYYKEIIDFAKEKDIKLIALNVNNEFKKIINAKGIDKLSDEEEKELPEIDLTDEYHRKHIKSIYDVHGRGTLDDFERFYQIQCLWDETMAHSAANYLKSSEGKGKQLIVLAGKGHIRYGFGIPKRLFRRMRELYCTILPIETHIPENKKHNIMNVEEIRVPLQESDFYWMVDYRDPDTVKVRLGVIVINSDNGVIVHNVDEGSSAESVGIKKGDAVISVDGVPIEETFDLIYEIKNKTPGQDGNILIRRDGKEMNLDIKYREKGTK